MPTIIEKPRARKFIPSVDHLLTALGGLGFAPDLGEKSRITRKVDGTSMYIDFLTGVPPATSGTRLVDSAVASVTSGIGRALESRREIVVAGTDAYGVTHKCRVFVADIGPLLVLKQNVYAGRRHPKDAYDIYLATIAYIGKAEAAVASYRAEGSNGNMGYARAEDALRQYFYTVDAEAPARAAAFFRTSAQ